MKKHYLVDTNVIIDMLLDREEESSKVLLNYHRHHKKSASRLAFFVKKSLKCRGFEIIAYICALKQSSNESRTWDKVIKQLNIRVI